MRPIGRSANQIANFQNGFAAWLCRLATGLQSSIEAGERARDDLWTVAQTGSRARGIKVTCERVMSGSSSPVLFQVEPLSSGYGYVIMATWPDGFCENLVGRFVSREMAETWIGSDSEAYVRARQLITQSETPHDSDCGSGPARRSAVRMRD